MLETFPIKVGRLELGTMAVARSTRSVHDQVQGSGVHSLLQLAVTIIYCATELGTVL